MSYYAICLPAPCQDSLALCCFGWYPEGFEISAVRASSVRRTELHPGVLPARRVGITVRENKMGPKNKVANPSAVSAAVLRHLGGTGVCAAKKPQSCRVDTIQLAARIGNPAHNNYHDTRCLARLWSIPV